LGVGSWFEDGAGGQIHLGMRKNAGRGVRRNDAEALLWFQRACRKEDAMFWYRRSAVLGDG